jgi:hypothetical protein
LPSSRDPDPPLLELAEPNAAAPPLALAPADRPAACSRDQLQRQVGLAGKRFKVSRDPAASEQKADDPMAHDQCSLDRVAKNATSAAADR